MAGQAKGYVPLLPEERTGDASTWIQAFVGSYTRRKSQEFSHNTPLQDGLQTILPSPQRGNSVDGGRREDDYQTGQTVWSGDGRLLRQT